MVVRRLSSKDGCRFVLGKARYGFLLVVLEVSLRFIDGCVCNGGGTMVAD